MGVRHLSVRVVSCFGPNTYDLYVKRFLETYTAMWNGVPLTVFYHDCDLPEDAKRFTNVQFANLNELDAEFVEFAKKAQYANGMGEDGQYRFRFDAKKFSAKVFATSLLAAQCPEDWLIWLDADTYTHAPVDEAWLHSLLDPMVDIVYLGRSCINYAETSFIGFNKARGKAQTLLADMRDIYYDGEIFTYIEHHDGFVFSRMLYLHMAHGMNAKSLTNEGYNDLEAFENSPLVEKMHHLKGNRKLEGDAKVTPIVNRYDQLNELVRHYAQGKETFKIIETGTWRGERAQELANAAFSVGVKKVIYEGYDLFENATEETDKVEFNSKAHNTVEEVGARLADFAEKIKINGCEFEFTLTKGDTKETLKPREADFAFLDGGHSEATVRWDYEQCCQVPVVVFDDYITEDDNGRSQPLEHQGTNIIFDDLLKGTKRAIVYPSNDPVMGGGHTHLALIVNDDVKEPPQLPETAGAWKKLVINPHDCVADQQLIDNVEENLKIITQWLKSCKAHSRPMVIVSGGPSVVKDMDEIRRRADEGAYVVAVKHALPYLKEAGITCHALVVLDPRPIDGISTHGVKREDLFADIPKGCNAWVASMTDPAVTRRLMYLSANVWGWHAQTAGLHDWKGWPKDVRLIAGGTCSAWRAVGLGVMLGFREYHIYGMDLSYDPNTVDIKQTDEKGRSKYLKVSPDKGKTFYYTTGELAAAAQDIQTIMALAITSGVEIYLHGEGFGPELWRSSYGSIDQSSGNFEDIA